MDEVVVQNSENPLFGECFEEQKAITPICCIRRIFFVNSAESHTVKNGAAKILMVVNR
ncbi:hypothetical protein CHISP_2020 [Chitinispirillum alkaliphilum]|nr:hypothetical protein CHISP_2020 [Chitinispirillum alkaliphilum]